MGDPGTLPEPVERRPTASVFRVSRRGRGPFSPPSWDWAPPSGVLGGRFADPRPWDGTDDGRFRIVYVASTREAAFGELLAPLRPALTSIDPPGPSTLEFGTVSREWRESRQIGQAHLDPGLSFVDIAEHRTLTYLRSALAPVARELGIEDFDLSAVTGPQRGFTRACARHLYAMRSADGNRRFAGIRYPSRLAASWECWAIFADRLRGVQTLPRLILGDDPDLLTAAAHLGLVVEASASG